MKLPSKRKLEKMNNDEIIEMLGGLEAEQAFKLIKMLDEDRQFEINEAYKNKILERFPKEHRETIKFGEELSFMLNNDTKKVIFENLPDEEDNITIHAKTFDAFRDVVSVILPDNLKGKATYIAFQIYVRELEKKGESLF